MHQDDPLMNQHYMEWLYQWGNFNRCLLKWNWLSPRLDDGRHLMVFQFVDSQANPLRDGLGLSYTGPARVGSSSGPDRKRVSGGGAIEMMSGAGRRRLMLFNQRIRTSRLF
jgi:hypothetical protein